MVWLAAQVPTNFDAATVSAFAASAAATAAAAVAAIQFFVGYRQSKAALIAARAAMMNAESVGRHTIAAFRQKWIEAVRDTLSEYHSILMTADDDGAVPPEDERKLVALKTKLELLLNPDEEDAQELLVQIGSMRFVDGVGRLEIDEALSKLAHKILKTEWVRIKSELSAPTPRP